MYTNSRIYINYIYIQKVHITLTLELHRVYQYLRQDEMKPYFTIMVGQGLPYHVDAFKLCHTSYDI